MVDWEPGFLQGWSQSLVKDLADGLSTYVSGMVFPVNEVASFKGRLWGVPEFFLWCMLVGLIFSIKGSCSIKEQKVQTFVGVTSVEEVAVEV